MNVPAVNEEQFIVEDLKATDLPAKNVAIPVRRLKVEKYNLVRG